MSRRNQTGEWAKQGRDLWTHPKVRRMASILGGQWQLELPLSGPDNGRTSAGQLPGQVRTTVLIHTVVGGLSWLFLTINRHASEAGDGTQDAVLSDMTTDTYFDEVTGLPGMQAAMIAVGWAIHDKAAAVIRLPNYLEHNTLHKGSRRAGARGDSESAEAVRKRKAREEEKRRRGVEAARTSAGQVPDNSALSAPDKRRTSADNSTEQSRAEQKLKTHLEKNGDMSGPDTITADLEAAKRIVDSLRPGSWGKVRHWSPTDEEALVRAALSVRQFTERDRKTLEWFFRWAEKPGNRDRWPQECNVTSKRAAFLDDLASYLGRAQTAWQSAGSPKLGLAASNGNEPAAAVAEVQDFTNPAEAVAYFQQAKAGTMR